MYGVQVPYTLEEDTEGVTWYSAFTEDLTKDTLWQIMERIIDCYNEEPNLISKI